MKRPTLVVFLAGLAGIGWVLFNRAGAPDDCIVVLDPVPGALAAFSGMDHSGNIELPGGLGHFRTFAVTQRFSASGQFYDGETYRDLTAANARYLCPLEGAVRTDCINDETHFARLCQTPDHIVEVDRDFISADLLIVDGDTMLELFLSQGVETSADIETSTCSMARAVAILNADHLAVQQ